MVLFYRVLGYTICGIPKCHPIGPKSKFSSFLFKSLAAQTGTELRFSGTESHNSIGVGEVYYRPLRRIF